MTSKGKISSGNMWGIGNVIGQKASSHVEVNVDINVDQLVYREASYALEMNPRSSSYQTNAFLRHPDAQYPELTHNIGHTAKLARLTALLNRAMETNNGAIVFLTGEYGYGKKALGRAFVDAVRKAKETAVIGRFWPDGNEEALFRDDRWAPELKKYQNVFQQGGDFLEEPPFSPLKPILAQIFDKEFPDGVPWGIDIPNSPESLRHFLREFVGPSQPLVILLEDFEHAKSEWMDLIQYLEPEINNGLPILLLVVLHAPRKLDALEEKQLTSFQEDALQLAKENRAEIYFLENIKKDDIVAYTGPAQTSIVDQLKYLSNGIPLFVELLWQEWTKWDVVEQTSSEEWQWNESAPQWVFGNTRDFVEGIIDDRWPVSDSPPWSREQMVEILACAAEIGLKFSVETLAYAFDVKPELMSLQLDTFLHSPYSPHKLALLEKEHPYQIELKSIKHVKNLNRYRFQPEVIWFILRQFYRDNLSKTRCGKLARGLEKAHWPKIEPVANKIAALYEKSGNAEKAAQYRRMFKSTNRFDELLLRIEIAKTFLPGHIAQSQVLTLFQKLGNQDYSLYNPKQARILFTDMVHVATNMGNRFFKALALYFVGSANYGLSQYEQAEAHYQRALEIFERLGREGDIALNVSSLGDVAKARGQYEQAEAHYQRSLEISERLGREDGIAVNVSSLGEVAYARGQYEQAEAHYQRSLEIFTLGAGK